MLKKDRLMAQAARVILASGALNTAGSIVVTQQSRHKQRLLDLLDPLVKLQEAKDLHIGLRCYAPARWAYALRSIDSLSMLSEKLEPL